MSITVEGPARVLHLCAGNMFGGVERIVAECAASRDRCQRMVPRFAVCFDGRLPADIERTGAACARLGDVKVSRPLTVLRARRALAALLARERPDAVICHSSWMHGLAAPTLRASGVRVALWIHDRVSGRSWAERWARLTAPDLVIANSRFTAASVPALFPDVPVAVLYAPVPSGGTITPDERSAIRRSLGVSDDRTVVILIASRFEAWKGHRELIAAAARVRGPWTLWIAGRPQRSGEDAYERSLVELARAAGVGDRVRLLGERHDVPSLMRAADIHCQPNTAPEPFGLAFVEALDAALPVVTTAMGGACEIVSDACGVLVPPDDPPRLAEALNRLAGDPAERRRLGTHGPARAHDLCDPARQLAALAALVAGVPARQVQA